MKLSAKSRHFSPRVARAFTLVELMVAMTAGLFFTVFVFMMTKDSSRFFQGQARLSESTLATLTGFERLRSDIARAGFLASPNFLRDANRCPRPPTGQPWPPASQLGDSFGAFVGMNEMALAHIDELPSLVSHPLVVNNPLLAPEKLVLWGNYGSADQFPVRTINFAANEVYLEIDSAALNRIGITAANVANHVTILQDIFRVGSIIRFVDETNRDQYSIINSVAQRTVGGDQVLAIGWMPTVGLVTKGGGGTLCGLRALGTGVSVNPVDIIRYRLQNLRGATYPQYDQIFTAAAQSPTYDADRLELVRERLNPNFSVVSTNNVLSTELIAEYAVDLRFGVTALSNPTTGQLTFLGENDGGRRRYSGLLSASVTQAANSGPHWIRGIHARLTIRNRIADREAPALAGAALANATAEDLIRISVDKDQFARTRSLRSHIATRNTRNEMWN